MRIMAFCRRLLTIHKDARGASAVEFALIAAPLVFLICACMELALIILLSVTLDNATDMASRQIRTGLTTQGNSDVTKFKQSICDNLGWLNGSCMSSLTVDVQTYDNFNLVPTTDPIKDGKYETANFAYVIGTGSKIQMVRAYYEWPMFTPFLQPGLSTLANNDVVITSKVVFRNEPF